MISKEDKKDSFLVQNNSFSQVFEEKFRNILFPEPYFSEYLKELESKNRTVTADWENIEKDKYVRYLRTWKKGVKLQATNRHLQMMREIHCHKLIKFIEHVFKEGNKKYTDLEIYVEDKRFLAHRLVIACYAPFIFYKLSRILRSEETKMIRLTGIKADPFSIILEYMYTGIAQPNDDNFLPVLDTAIRFFMYEFADTWVELYEEKFGSLTSQLLFRSKIARKYKWTNYIKKLNKVLALDFENLLISQQFLELSYEELSDLLKENEIGVRNEVILYLAILKWIKFDLEKRQQFVLSLVGLIRFAFMSEKEIHACYNPPILKDAINKSEIKALMADALNYHIKKRTIGKSVELPSSIEMRTYRLTNTSQLKLWSVEDEKLDQVKFENLSEKNNQYKLDLVSSGEMEIKDITCKNSNKEEKDTQKKVCVNVSEASHKLNEKKAHEASGVEKWTCSCEVPNRHVNFMECQKEKAALRIQSSFKNYMAKKENSTAKLNASLSSNTKELVGNKSPNSSTTFEALYARPQELNNLPKSIMDDSTTCSSLISSSKNDIINKKTLPEQQEKTLPKSYKSINYTDFFSRISKQILVMFCDDLQGDKAGIYTLHNNENKSLKNTFLWKKLAHFKQKNSFPFDTVVLSFKNNIFVIGGLLKNARLPDAHLNTSRFIYKYSLKEKSLKKVGELRVPRVLHCAATVGQKLYIVGGLRSLSIPVNTIEIFDLQDMSLDAGQLRIPSSARFGACCAQFRGRLWIIGGIAKIENSFHLLSDIWILDPVRQRWTRAKFPVPVAYACMIAVDDETLYLVGGRCVNLNGQLQPSKKVWTYSHSNRRWSQSSSLFQGRCNASLLQVNKSIILLGGCNENEVENLRGTLVEWLDLDDVNKEWHLVEKLPIAVCGNAITCIST